MNWADHFRAYAVDIAKIYVNEPEHILNCLRFESVAGSLNECYLALKDLKRIEELDTQRKASLWERSKMYADTKDRRIKVSRAIYLLEELTK